MGSRCESRSISRVLSRTVIHLGRTSPCASSDLPGSDAGRIRRSQDRLPPYLVLLQVGFTVPRRVATRAVRSYRTFSPLPVRAIPDVGGIFSVALSVGWRLPGVTWHLARWSPDFPPRRQTAQRLSDRLSQRNYTRCRGALGGYLPESSSARRYNSFRPAPVIRAASAAACFTGSSFNSSSSTRSASRPSPG
jgi:hypothetical protein